MKKINAGVASTRDWSIIFNRGLRHCKSSFSTTGLWRSHQPPALDRITPNSLLIKSTKFSAYNSVVLQDLFTTLISCEPVKQLKKRGQMISGELSQIVFAIKSHYKRLQESSRRTQLTLSGGHRAQDVPSTNLRPRHIPIDNSLRRYLSSRLMICFK